MNVLVASIFCLAFSSSVVITANGHRSNILNYIFRPRNDLPLPELAKSLGLEILVKFLDDAELSGALSGKGPFTLFAPTNKAFEELPLGLAKYLKNNETALAEVLKYHVLSLSASVFSYNLTNEELAPTLQGKSVRANIYGKVVTINGARVTQADKRASNGVLHVIDKVLLPPGGSLVELAIGCPKLSTLVTAVKAAELVDTLNGTGPFTLFTPMDSAFAKIPPAELEKLLHDKTALTNVLTYHVIKGTFYSAGLQSGDVPTLNGQSITVKVSEAGVTLNGDIKVILADVTATNGVAHAIDTVLMPKTMSFEEIIAKPNPKFMQLFK